MKHVMLDLETLGTNGDAVVLSIGAVEMTREGLSHKFHRVLDIDEQLRQHGRSVNGSTILWWGDQDREAWRAATQGSVSVGAALRGFADFMTLVGGEYSERTTCVWGNGSDFDNAILGSLYEAAGIKRPWGYSKNRCYRTLKSLHPNAPPIERAGTHHNALDDAVYQANHWYKLMEVSKCDPFA